MESGVDLHGIATNSCRVANDIDSNGCQRPRCFHPGKETWNRVVAAHSSANTHKIYSPARDIEDKNWPQPGPEAGSEWYSGYLAGKYAEGEGLSIFWEADEAVMALIGGSKGGQYEDLEESCQSWMS